MIKFRDYSPPCYPGSLTLPPVLCKSYTGRRWNNGLKLDDVRIGFHDAIDHIDAPDFIPAGSHCGPNVTVNGKPSMDHVHTIYASEIAREGL